APAGHRHPRGAGRPRAAGGTGGAASRGFRIVSIEPGWEMSTELRGKAAIVTGASKGIGYAVAESMARAGIDVLIWARNEGEGAAAAEQLNALGGGGAVGTRCVMRSHPEVASMVERAVEEFGGLVILVNNA